MGETSSVPGLECYIETDFAIPLDSAALDAYAPY